MTRQWQTALQRAGVRTGQLFDAGRPVADAVRGRLRYELRATWTGGTRILRRLEATEFDVFKHRPSLGISDGLVIALKTMFWRQRSA
jgi:phytoene synthase